jgi:hypothetical protein
MNFVIHREERRDVLLLLLLVVVACGAGLVCSVLLAFLRDTSKHARAMRVFILTNIDSTEACYMLISSNGSPIVHNEYSQIKTHDSY